MYKFGLALVSFLATCACNSRTCDEIEHDARALLASNQSCTAAGDCMVVSVHGDCLSPFLCSQAVNKSTNLSALSERAEELSAEYRGSCNTCIQADCVDPNTLTATCSAEGRCEVSTGN